MENTSYAFPAGCGRISGEIIFAELRGPFVIHRDVRRWQGRKLGYQITHRLTGLLVVGGLRKRAAQLIASALEALIDWDSADETELAARAGAMPIFANYWHAIREVRP